MSLGDTLRFITRHPLSANHQAGAIARFVRWQLASRLLPGAWAVDWIEGTRLLVRRGMTGATGNLYVGLHEFEDMAFVVHCLRPGDLFVDVGANVGTYTILAAGVAGASCISFEPVPSTFRALLDNVNLNRLAHLVEAVNAGAGSAAAVMKFTTTLDTVNHVVAPADDMGATEAIDVRIDALDVRLSSSRAPTLLKIDVEGYETEVIAGAEEVLSRPGVLGVLMELNGSGARYRFDESKLHAAMLARGFSAFAYDPFYRELRELRGRAPPGNALYLRDAGVVQDRLRSARRIRVLDVWL